MSNQISIDAGSLLLVSSLLSDTLIKKKTFPGFNIMLLLSIIDRLVGNIKFFSFASVDTSYAILADLNNSPLPTPSFRCLVQSIKSFSTWYIQQSGDFPFPLRYSKWPKLKVR